MRTLKGIAPASKGSSALWIRLFLSIAMLAFFLYQTIAKQNSIAKLRLEIPKLEKELGELEDENTRLSYEIEKNENPLNLMEYARKPEYRSLKHPLESQIVTIEEER